MKSRTDIIEIDTSVCVSDTSVILFSPLQLASQRTCIVKYYSTVGIEYKPLNQANSFIPAMLTGSIYLFHCLGLGLLGQWKAKLVGFIVMPSSQIVEMKFDVVLLLFKPNILTLVYSVLLFL